MEAIAPYSKGDSVPAAGEYVCVPCGFKRQYQAGEHFGECLSCLSGTAQGQHEDFVEGMEMWEPVETPPSL
jgi:hypothetical protein